MTSGRASDEKEAPLESFGDFDEELALDRFVPLAEVSLVLILADFRLNNPILDGSTGKRRRLAIRMAAGLGMGGGEVKGLINGLITVDAATWPERSDEEVGSD